MKIDDKPKAHEKGYLQSQLLIAMPAMVDPAFKKTVTLICQHNTDGCFGLTINRPIQIGLNELFDQLHISSTNKTINKMSAFRGGPVQPEQGFVIHENDPSGRTWENTLKINDTLSVTASRDILQDIADDKGPANFLLTLGCASWSSGQIEQEMLDNSWLNCPTDNSILFDISFDQRWQSAMDILGIDANRISGVAGHA